MSNLSSIGTVEASEERETDLSPYASEWDLKLFREAQALASEDIESSLKGLPDAKAIKYIEMGKHEMEVDLLGTYLILYENIYSFVRYGTKVRILKISHVYPESSYANFV